mgnify:CR=1 FL=1
MSKFVLVGGGISSCVIALFLLKNKHQVEIYEKRSYLGGILNDVSDKENIFFRGCQYLDVNNQWFKFFKDEFEDELDIFEHTYGSYVEIDGKKSLSKDFAVPYFDRLDLENYDPSENIAKPRVSVEDRFDLYPKNIKNFFSKIYKRHKLDPKEICFSCVDNLQVGRITSGTEANKILQLKKTDKIFDDIFAVQRQMVYDEIKLLGALPKLGFTKLFESIKRKLLSYGVKIFTNSIVRPEWKNDKLELTNKNEKIDCDYILWTGDPTKLIKGQLNKDIESKYVRILQTNANILDSSNFDKRYFQIFSDEKILTKIYLYNIDGKKKISVESMYEKKSSEEILSQAVDILKKFNINLKLDRKSFKQSIDVRFNVVSINDEKTIKEFLNKTEKTNLLPGAWLLYGRDRRMHFYLDVLKEKGLI